MLTVLPTSVVELSLSINSLRLLLSQVIFLIFTTAVNLCFLAGFEKLFNFALVFSWKVSFRFSIQPSLQVLVVQHFNGVDEIVLNAKVTI